MLSYVDRASVKSLSGLNYQVQAQRYLGYSLLFEAYLHLFIWEI